MIKCFYYIITILFFSSANIYCQKINVSFYDSLFRDSCTFKALDEKTYCICLDKFNKISRLITISGFKKNNYWKIYSTHEGSLFKEGEVKNGKKNGVWKEYFLDGHEMHVGSYKNGKKEGVWNYYYSKDFDLRTDEQMKLKIGVFKYDKDEKIIYRNVIHKLGGLQFN